MLNTLRGMMILSHILGFQEGAAPDVCRHLESLPQAARGPMYGVPFAVKDNIDVAGFPTTAACEAYKYHPPKSAPAVQRLVDAGARLSCTHCVLTTVLSF